ncbi:hypothetical protein GN956_G8962 [Arapaima gigas]
MVFTRSIRPLRRFRENEVSSPVPINTPSSSPTPTVDCDWYGGPISPPGGTSDLNATTDRGRSDVVTHTSLTAPPPTHRSPTSPGLCAQTKCRR